MSIFSLNKKLRAWVRHRRITEGLHGTYIGNNRMLIRMVVQKRVMVFYVDANDRLLTPYLVATGTYEKDSTTFLASNLREDSHCVDVGANFGYFTCLMGKFARRGRVIGVEADAQIAALALENVFINHLQDSCDVQHAAASDNAGELQLFRRVTRAGNTSIIDVGRDYTDRFQETPAEPFAVQSIRIDDLLPKFDGRIDFMKVDVEGAEPLAFAGAAEAIRTNPQMQIVMEWSPGQIQHAGFSISEFLAALAAMGLQPFVIAKGEPASISFDTLQGLPYLAGVLLRSP